MLPWKDRTALQKSIRWRWLREAEQNRRRARERQQAAAQAEDDGSGLRGQASGSTAQTGQAPQGPGEKA